MFGPDKPVHLVLIELPAVEKAMQGLVMELMDGSYDLCAEISTFTNVQDGFKDIDAAVLVGSKPRGPGMIRSDLIGLNGEIFKEQGKALNDFAKKTVKVCVVGNPCCTNALIASANAPDIPSKNFSAMLRLDENRAKTCLALMYGIKSNKHIAINVWGNHSNTMYPFLDDATINGDQSLLTDLLANKDGSKDFYNKEISMRGQAIIDACGKSSAASAANAACNHMYSWWYETKTPYSMGVILGENDKLANCEKAEVGGLCFGISCVTNDKGEWEAAKFDKQLDYDKIKENVDSLSEEKRLASEFF